MTDSHPFPAQPPAGVPTSTGVWAVAVVMWLYYLTPLLAPSAHRLDPLMVVLSIACPAVALVLLVFRRRVPVAVVVGIGLLLFFSPGVIGAALGMQASVARRARRAWVVALAAAWFVLAKLVSLLAGPFYGPWETPHTVEFTIAVVGLAFATLIGWLARSRAAEQRGRLETEQARQEAEWARIEQAKLAERERIAREMHDVLAHRLSLVSMNAGVLAFRTDLSPEETRETARLIQAGVKQSLDELRAVLSTLRGADAPPEPPQPTLAELPVLVADLEDDQRIALEIDVDVARVPAQVGRHAYRIVQEALTNARKHAPGAPVRVSISGEPGTQLEVRVSNPLADLATPDRTGSGFGLLGLTERAASVGGSVSYGPLGGDFVVAATLPWKDES